jgi:plastocyanin
MKLLALASVVLGLAASGPGPAANVAMPGRFYAPANLDLLVGTTVTWQNQDSTSHTVTSDDDAFDSGYVPPGGTYERLFDKPGVFKFHCTIHRFMRGIVKVYSLVLVGPDRPLAAGTRLVLTGRAPAGTSEVVLERTTGKGWQLIATSTLPADGTFVFRAVAEGPAHFRARAGKTASPVVRVEVAPTVTVRVAGGRVSVATHPARPGARAVLQAYDRERFTFLGTTSVRLGPGGTGSLPLPPGPAHLRVLIAGSEGWSPGVSRVLVIP